MSDPTIETRVAMLESYRLTDQRVDRYILRIIVFIAILRFLGIDNIQSLLKMFQIVATTFGPQAAYLFMGSAAVGSAVVIASINLFLNRGQI